MADENCDYVYGCDMDRLFRAQQEQANLMSGGVPDADPGR